jgi:hypothetical protein
MNPTDRSELDVVNSMFVTCIKSWLLAAAGAYSLGNEEYVEVATNYIEDNKKGGSLENVAAPPY